ncbi:hypothetical protein EJB05_14525, partial [Eragrostis curvula]
MLALLHCILMKRNVKRGRKQYERQRLANVKRNKRRLEALNIPRLELWCSNVGKDVILFVIIRSEQPEAKGTIISTKPSTIVDGQAIGREFCEVIVTHVLKRDAILPHPIPPMETMGDALMMAIAWLYKKDVLGVDMDNNVMTRVCTWLNLLFF